MRTLNLVTMYAWAIMGMVAVVAALFGATHQLFVAAVCFAFYLVARRDLKEERAKAKPDTDEESE